MLYAGVGLSLLEDPRCAGEEATFAALLRCDRQGFGFVMVFATHHHADAMDAVMTGAQSMAGSDRVTGCAGPAVVTEAGVIGDVPGVVALAVEGDGFLLRTAQAPRGPADGGSLVRELGAPRGTLLYTLFPGPEAGHPTVLLHGMTGEEGPSVFGVGLTGPWGEPATADPYVEAGGTLAWLLAGPGATAHVSGPGSAVALQRLAAKFRGRTPVFGLYFGAAGGDPDGEIDAIHARFPGLPVAGLVGAYALTPEGRGHAMFTDRGVLLVVLDDPESARPPG